MGVYCDVCGSEFRIKVVFDVLELSSDERGVHVGTGTYSVANNYDHE